MSEYTKSTKRQSLTLSQRRRPRPEYGHGKKTSPNRYSPIEKLPIEITCEIFEEYVELDQSPGVLASVSRRWNSLAFANPRLWTHIEILPRSRYFLIDWEEYPIVDTTRMLFTRGKFQVCESKEEVEAAFSRAGSLNTHILCRRRSYGGVVASGLIHALSSPLSSRIGYLEMHDFSDNICQAVGSSLLGPFPQLRHLFIEAGYNGPGGANLLHDILLASPSLLNLRVAANIRTSPHLFPFWSRLRVLDISPLNMRSDIFDSIVSRCSHLVEFSTRGCLWPGPHTNISSEMLSSVQVAKLTCALPLLSKFHFCHLRSLDLKDFCPWRTRVKEVVKLDTVTSLRITLERSSKGLRYLDMPNLRKLEIIKEDTFTDTKLDILSSITFPVLTYLSVTADWEEKMFINSLDTIPNIRKIECILKRGYGGSIWDQLFDKLAGGGGHLVCAKLESLVLGSVAHPVNMRKSVLDDLIRHVNDYRTGELAERIRIEIYNRVGVEVERLEYNA